MKEVYAMYERIKSKKISRPMGASKSKNQLGPLVDDKPKPKPVKISEEKKVVKKEDDEEEVKVDEKDKLKEDEIDKDGGTDAPIKYKKTGVKKIGLDVIHEEDEKDQADSPRINKKEKQVTAVASNLSNLNIESQESKDKGLSSSIESNTKRLSERADLSNNSEKDINLSKSKDNKSKEKILDSSKDSEMGEPDFNVLTQKRA